MKQIANTQEFDDLIAQGGPVVADFFAVWCGPCRAIAPQFEALSKTFSNVQFVKVDVEANPDLSAKMAITAMPTFILFKGGVKVTTIMGADPLKLEQAVKSIAA